MVTLLSSSTSKKMMRRQSHSSPASINIAANSKTVVNNNSNNTVSSVNNAINSNQKNNTHATIPLFDSTGRCSIHPHITLRSRGLTSIDQGRWHTITSHCPACANETASAHTVAAASFAAFVVAAGNGKNDSVVEEAAKEARMAAANADTVANKVSNNGGGVHNKRLDKRVGGQDQDGRCKFIDSYRQHPQHNAHHGHRGSSPHAFNAVKTSTRSNNQRQRSQDNGRHGGCTSPDDFNAATAKMSPRTNQLMSGRTTHNTNNGVVNTSRRSRQSQQGASGRNGHNGLINNRFNKSDTSLFNTSDAAFHRSDRALFNKSDSASTFTNQTSRTSAHNNGSMNNKRFHKSDTLLFHQSDSSLSFSQHQGRSARGDRNGLNSSTFNKSKTSLFHKSDTELSFCEPCSSPNDKTSSVRNVIHRNNVLFNKSEETMFNTSDASLFNKNDSALTFFQPCYPPKPSPPPPAQSKAQETSSKQEMKPHSLLGRRVSLSKKKPDPPSSTVPRHDTPSMIRRCQSSTTAFSSRSNRTRSPPTVLAVSTKKTSKGRELQQPTSSDHPNQAPHPYQQNSNDCAVKFHGRITRNSASNNIITSKTSSANANSATHYQMGETLRDDTHSLPFSSSSQAFTHLTKLPINSPLFVKRTTRDWTYAILVGRLADGYGDMSLIVVLDRSEKVKKVLERSKWEKCLRLVNGNVVDASASAGAMGTKHRSVSKTASFHRKNSASKLQRRSSASNNNSKSVSFHGLDTNSTVTTATSSTAHRMASRNNATAKTTSNTRNNGNCAHASTSKSMSLHQGVTSNSTSSSGGSTMEKLMMYPLPPAINTSNSTTTKSKSQTISPTTIMVNLNAKHFCGSRRDRMRPRGMPRKNSAPSLLQLGSLSGSGSSQASRDGGDMSSDSTCAHNNAGGGLSDSGTGGSLWNSWSSFDSSCDSLKYMNTPPPPYGKGANNASALSNSSTWDSALGGGMMMRLRGVDP